MFGGSYPTTPDLAVLSVEGVLAESITMSVRDIETKVMTLAVKGL